MGLEYLMKALQTIGLSRYDLELIKTYKFKNDSQIRCDAFKVLKPVNEIRLLLNEFEKNYGNRRTNVMFSDNASLNFVSNAFYLVNNDEELITIFNDYLLHTYKKLIKNDELYLKRKELDASSVEFHIF